MSDKRRLKVDMFGLTEAFELHIEGVDYYFDTETGEVLRVDDETRYLLRRLAEERYAENGERLVPFEDVLAQHPEIPDWQQPILLEAVRVERDFGTRIVAVDPEPYSDYNDMESFIFTVEDSRLANELEYAIRGRGAFRRFKDILAFHPRVREAWFAFKSERIMAQVQGWLDSLGIEPIEETEQPPF